MKKYFIPEIKIDRFELESVVTESSGAVGAWEKEQSGQVDRISMDSLKKVRRVF